MAQYLEFFYGVQSHGKTQYNYDRTLRMGTFGLFMAGPLLHTWYRQLHVMTAVYRWKYVQYGKSTSAAGSSSFLTSVISQNFKREKLESGKDIIKHVFTKVAFDQLFFQAAFLNFYLFTMSIMEGLTIGQAIEKVKKGFHDAWAYSMCFWVPAQSLNFTLVPPKHHALVVNVANVCWQTFLSLLFHSRDYGHDDDEVAVASTSADGTSATDSVVGDISPVVGTLGSKEIKRKNDLIQLLLSQQAEMQQHILDFAKDEFRRSQSRERQVLALQSAIDAQAQQLADIIGCADGAAEKK